MGNRATVVLGSDTSGRGVYLHWNGGAGSVAAFIEEARIRMGGIEKIDSDSADKFYAVLFGVAREFFSYATEYKNRGTSSVYIEKDARGMGVYADNGCYVLANNLTCDKTDSLAFDSYDWECYKGIKNFFERSHAALCLAADGEHHRSHLNEPTVESVTKEIEQAMAVAKEASQRLDRLNSLYKELVKQAHEAEA